MFCGCKVPRSVVVRDGNWTCEGCGESQAMGEAERLAHGLVEARWARKAHWRTPRVNAEAWDAEFNRLDSAAKAAQRAYDRAFPKHMGHAFVAPERRG
jgi:hypothetical protein